MKPRYFSPETDPRLYRCPCGQACDAPHPTPALLAALDQIRERVGRPVAVTSGPRCQAYNARVGGVGGSAHLTGEAADIACPSSPLRYSLLQAAYAAGISRIGIGRDFIHVDVSETLPGSVAWTYYPQ